MPIKKVASIRSSDTPIIQQIESIESKVFNLFKSKINQLFESVNQELGRGNAKSIETMDDVITLVKLILGPRISVDSSVFSRQRFLNEKPSIIAVLDFCYRKAASETYLLKNVLSALTKSRSLPINPSVLEVGCGEGIDSNTLLETFSASKVVGIDDSTVKIGEANKNKTSTQISYIEASIIELNNYDDFDILIMIHPPMGMNDLDRYLNRSLLHVKPGGFVICIHYGEIEQQIMKTKLEAKKEFKLLQTVESSILMMSSQIKWKLFSKLEAYDQMYIYGFSLIARKQNGNENGD